MIRLHITAEGPTEQNFVKNVLAPHLATFDVFADARSVLTSKDNRTAKKYRGGLQKYAKAKNDIQAWLREDSGSDCCFTTMFDFYGLPQDFPGFTDASSKTDPYDKVRILEERMTADIGDRRFIPYIQLHEFEALILADPQQLGREYLERGEQISNLIAMVGGQNPELINEGQHTAPSKRILKQIPEYDKATGGVAVVGRIGLPRLRERCQHFNEWLTRLENLCRPQP